MTEQHEAPLDAEEALEADVSESVAEPAPPEQEDVVPEKSWDQEVEDEAKLFGWKSPSEWKGEVPPGYIDNPADYMDRLSRSAPFRKAMELAEQAKESARKTQAAMESAYKRDLERQQQAYEDRMSALSARRRQAAEEADLETYDRIDRAMRETPRPEREAPAQPEDILAPHYDGHGWLKDPVMRQHGFNLVDAALRDGSLQTSDAGEQIKYAEEKLKGYFPHIFEAPKPKPKPRVEGSGMVPAAKKTGFDTLPKDARDVFAKQVKQGVFEDTKEDREFFYNEYQNG